MRLAAIISLIVASFTQTFSQSLDWAQSIGDAASQQAADLITDANGDLFVAGNFQGDVDFDPGVGVELLNASPGITYGYFAKYDVLGTYEFAKALSSGTEVAVQAIAHDGSGNILVAGTFVDDVDVDPSPAVNQLVSVGVRAVFVAKYDAAGNLIWGESFDCTGNVAIGDMTSDGTNVYITGHYQGQITISTTFTSSSGADIFFSKLNGSGMIVLEDSYGQALDQIAYGVVALGNEEFFLTGIYSDGVDFGNGVVVSENSNVSGFLTKFNASGVAESAITLGGVGDQEIVVLEKDASDNLLLAGHMNQEVVLDGSNTLSIVGTQADDIFIAKYNASLQLQWGEVIGSNGATNTHVVKKLTSDVADRVYVAGEFSGVLGWDPQDLGTTQTAVGTKDLFVTVLDRNGNFDYGFQVGGAAAQVSAAGIAANSSEELLLHGDFDAASVDFDPEAGVQNLTFAGGEDAFFMSVGLPDVTGPAVPTVDFLSTTSNLPTLTGTYDDTDGSLTQVEVNGIVYPEAGAHLTVGPGPSWTLVIPAGNELPEGAYDVQVTAEDPLANLTIETIVGALLIDITAPVLTLNGPAGVVVLQNSTYNDLGATATDNLEGDISGAVTVDLSGLDMSTPGSYVVTYNVSDAAGNPANAITRTVDVIEEPLVCNDQVLYRINVGGTQVAATDAGPFWSQDDNTTASPFRIGGGGGSIFGVSNSITIDYSLVPTAAADNVFLTERWDPPGAPEMKWEFPVDPGSNVTVSLLLMEGFDGNTDPGDRVFDVSIEGSVPPVFDDIDPVGDFGTGVAFVLEHSYVAADGILDLEFLHVFENPTIRGIQICGSDLSPPNLTLLGAEPLELLTGETYVEPGATAIDAVAGDVTGSIVIDNSNVDTNTPGVYQVTYDVSDPFGNAAPQVIRTVIVSDLELPVDCENVLYRVNVGGPTIASNDGKLEWSGDTGNFPDPANSPYLVTLGTGNTIFLGNAGSAYPGPIIGGNPTAPSFMPLEVFNSERFDQIAPPAMRWEFPIVAGTEVQATLLFAELFGQITLPGERVFDVEVEGTVSVQMNNLDPFDNAGAKGAFSRSTTVQVDDGTLDIEFIHVVENPAIKGFQICAVKWVPTVDQLVTNNTNPTLTGTTSLAPGESFTVEFEGVTYDLDTDPELTRSGIVWSLDLSGIAPLTGGTYPVIATRVDINTNSIVDVSDQELIIDTQPPAVPTVVPQITNNPTPILVGTAEAGTTVSINVGGAVYTVTADGANAWAVDTQNDIPTNGAFNPNTDGVNEVVVTSTDEAGNTTNDATSGELAIDTVIPPIPTINVLVTNDPTPVIGGTAEAGTDISVIVGGATYNTVAIVGGIWIVDTENDVPAVGPFNPDVNGTNEVQVTSTDAAGNNNSDNTLEELTIDTTPPAIPTVLSQLTNNSTPLLAGTADEGTTVTVEVGGATYTTTADASDSWTVNTQTDIPVNGVFNPDLNGTNEVVVTSADAAGNETTDTTFGELVLDTTPPAAPVVLLLTTNDPDPVVSGTAEANSMLTVVVGGATFMTFANGGGNWSVDTGNETPTAGVFAPNVNGVNQVEATSADAAGNSSQDVSVDELTIDTILPATPTIVAQLTDDATPVLSGTAEIASSVTVTVGGATFTTVADGAGTWTVDTENETPSNGSFVPDVNGVNEVEVTSTDAAGNSSSDATSNELTIDTTFPVTPTVVSQLTNDITPDLTGTAEATTTVTIEVAGATFTTTADGSDQWAISTQNDSPSAGVFNPDTNGANEVIVTSTDAAGNSTGDATTNELSIDAVAPVDPTVTPQITNVTAPVISGTAEAASSLVIEVAGATYNTTADGGGNWSLDTGSEIPAAGVFAPDVNGPNEVNVTSTDAATNSSFDVTNNELVIDTTFPISPTAVAQLTNDLTPLLAGTAEAGTTVTVEVAGATYQTTADVSDSWTVNTGTEPPIAGSFAPVINGSNDVMVTSEDAAGNASTDVTINELTIDTTPPPTPTVVSLLTNDPTPTLQGTAEASSTVSVAVGGATFLAITNAGGNWVLDTEVEVPSAGTYQPNVNGVNQVVATSTDGAGNSSVDVTSDELTIDTSPPAIPTVAVQVTNEVEPTLTGTAETGSTLEVSVAGATYFPTVDVVGNWAIDLSIATPTTGTFVPNLNGANEVTLISTDNATNASSDNTTNELVIDTTPPVVTVNSLITKDQTPPITGNVDDPSASIEVNVNGTDYAAVNGGDGTWSLADNSVSTLPEGTLDVTATATDLATNGSSDATSNELTIDITAPVVAIDPLTTSDATPLVSGTIDTPDATITVSVNGQTYAGVNNGTTWSAQVTDFLNDGVYNLSVSATDPAGNTGVDVSDDELTLEGGARIPTVTVSAIEGFDFTPGLSGTVDDELAIISVTINGLTYPALNGGDGTWSIANDFIDALPVGTYDVLVEALSPSDLVGTDNTGGEVRVLPRTTTLGDPTDIAVNSYNVSWELLEGGVATYIVEVSEFQDFSTIITSFQELSGEDSFVAVTGLAYNTNYFTRAKVVYQSGDISEYSPIVQARTLTDPNLAADSLTLISIYEATGGEAWINTTNWQEGRVDTWHGVTVEDGRVTRLDFAGNNLIGSIGDITDSFQLLISMDLSDNELTEIGNLSELSNLQIADVSRNRLPFGALQNLRATGAQILFEGQGLLLQPITFLVEQGAEFLFDREISGTGNVYTWFKDDALISPTSSSFTVDVNSFEQEGSYYAQVTNPDFPGVTLRTTTVTLKVSSEERDRESLLAIYEATAGDSWTNGADWPNNPNMDSWIGVTVDNNRVTELSLANSNLSGDIPDDLLDVVNLTFLDISGNSITRIPDLRSLENLTAPDVSNNLLDFGDLEGNAEIPSINYLNQRPFGEAQEVHFVKGSDPVLSVTVGGSANKYEWLFRGVVTDQEISVATTETHTVTDLQYLNMGDYLLQVTSSLVPGLTLISEPQTILATIDVRLTATYSDSDGKSHVLDEGEGALLKIMDPGQPFDTVAVRQVIGNELVFEDVVLGDYLVGLRTDTLLLKTNSLGTVDSICLLPTYFRSTFLWEDAERLVVRNQVEEEMVMQQKPLNVDIGDNVVRLLVESDFVNDNDAGARIQARRTVKRAGCSLRRRRRATGGRGESDGEVYDLVAYRETDENGRVTFTDLPDGYYRLNIEYPGIPMDPTSFVEFQIGDGGLEQNSLTLEATVDETGIEVELVEILKIMGSYFEDVSIYPNPASKDLNVAYAGLTRDGVVMQMLDLQGRLFKEEELVRSQDNVMTMDVSDLNPGLYLLRFIDPTNDEGIIVFKVQIKR